VLDGLHRLGITIAIDDFGSGNCSPNDFRHLPIDEIKLDPSLSASITEEPRVAAIVRSVIDLSRTLGLTTVAEGVETSATAAMLTGCGCDIAQGHHYCQPLTASQTLELLTQFADATDRRERECVNGSRSGHRACRRQDSDRKQLHAGQATASSRSGAVTTALRPSPSFQTLALSVSPGNTTPANRAP
jgi:predicted signal transduction protein with EAL and GGDEF domain